MQKYGSGKFTLAQLIAPAIVLARDGIPVDDDIADSLPYVRADVRALARLRKDFPAPRRQGARPRRPPGANRSGAHALRDRAQRPARVL